MKENYDFLQQINFAGPNKPIYYIPDVKRYLKFRMLRVVCIVALVFLVSVVSAHCQVPCGIYDDPARVNQLLEDATTIKKAVAEINSLHELESRTATQSNQFVRWVNTKEKHASNMITILGEYFMVQVSNSGFHPALQTNLLFVEGT